MCILVCIPCAHVQRPELNLICSALFPSPYSLEVGSSAVTGARLVISKS